MKSTRPWLALALVVAAAWSAVLASRSSSGGPRVDAVPAIALDAWRASGDGSARPGHPPLELLTGQVATGVAAITLV